MATIADGKATVAKYDAHIVWRGPPAYEMANIARCSFFIFRQYYSTKRCRNIDHRRDKSVVITLSVLDQIKVAMIVSVSTKNGLS